MTNCTQYGARAEQHFAMHARARGWILRRATRHQDINEHWDWRIQQGNQIHLVDVKARKKINRHDTNQQDEWVWVELHSVRPDNRGWLYDGRATLIAFEIQNSFVIVPRQALIDLVQQHVSSRYGTSARDARYCIYQRQGRCDKLTLIEMQLLFPIAWAVWS